MASASALAPAKINLTLHVTGQRADGYHLLDSLVVFTQAGDHLEVEPASTLSLSVSGPFSKGLSTGADNLVMQAALASRSADQGAALHLTKSLPVASGIGGGSADAAAALRLLSDVWDVPLPDLKTQLRLGADVPVCLASQPVRMRGIGEQLDPLPDLPEMHLVLVNCLTPVSTAQVFGNLACRDNPAMPDLPEAFSGFRDFISYLSNCRNDLEQPAIQAQPVIGHCLEALNKQDVCALARMSGSGATCFGMFEHEGQALAAADALRRSNPDWWVVATPLFTPRD